MFETMKKNADFWTICLSHTLGCAINGVKSKAGIFGIEKSKFDGPDEFIKEARRHRKLPKSATKGKNLLQIFLPMIKTKNLYLKIYFMIMPMIQTKIFFLEIYFS